jgi:hypothetical protein
MHLAFLASGGRPVIWQTIGLIWWPVRSSYWRAMDSIAWHDSHEVDVGAAEAAPVSARQDAGMRAGAFHKQIKFGAQPEIVPRAAVLGMYYRLSVIVAQGALGGDHARSHSRHDARIRIRER